MRTRLEREEAAIRLGAQQRVARALLEADDLAGVAPDVLEAMAQALDWPLAAMWEVPGGPSALHFVGGWDAAPGGAELFWQMSHSSSFVPGMGLPGKAWSTGQPVWMIELPGHPDLPRYEGAEAAGLRAGLAIPIPVGPPDDVVAVAEFFTREPNEPDDEVKQLLVAFGDQVAQFVERRKAEQAVRRSEALKSAILEAAMDCVIVIDAQGRIQEFNAAAETTFGLRRTDVIGQEMAELLIPPALRDRHRAGLRRFLETGKGSLVGKRVELTAMRADGSEFPIELAITAIPASVPPLFTGYVRDISERRRAEAMRRHLAAIVETTDDAVESIDLDGIITAWNPGAERMYGYKAEQIVGRRASVLVPFDRREEPAEMLEALQRGEAIDNRESERVRADGTRVAVALTMSPIVDAAGRITGASVISRDVTERKHAETTKEFLAAASATLDSSLDPETTIRTIAQTAVPELAELCVIDLLDEEGLLGPAVAVATSTPVAQELEDLRRRFPLDLAGSHPVAQVLRSRRPMVIRDLADPRVVEQVAQSDEHRAFMRRAGYSSAAVVPLVARGRTLGALSLLHVRDDRRYDTSDLEMLQDLAARAAMALDNARLFAERAHVAGTLQRSLLPDVLPEPPGAELAAAYWPAREGVEVGGDFYDAFEAGDGWVFAVGDVCGKGAEAAALTSLLRYSVRAFTLEHDSPSRVLELVNEAMLHEDRQGRFATAALARVALGTNPVSVRVGCAGHPPPLLLRRSQALAVEARGTLLGVDPNATIPEVRFSLEAGDTLVLHTDGVLDAGAPTRTLTSEQLAAALAQVAPLGPAAVVSRAVELARENCEGNLRDDVAVLALRIS